MQKTQIWSPDTCGCRIEQVWDTDFPQAAPKMSRFLTLCEFHDTLDEQTAYAAIYENAASEQKRKNSIALVLQADDSDAFVDIKANGDRVLKPEIEIRWEFSGKGADRALSFDVVGVAALPEGKIDSLQADLATALSTDQVAPTIK